MALQETFSILIADDSAMLRQRLKALILARIANACFDETGDALTALALAQATHPLATILDLRLPGGGGLRAIQTLKQQHLTSALIILTNYAYPQYRQQCLENGADYFLDKSSDFEHIPEILQQIWSREHSHDPRST